MNDYNNEQMALCTSIVELLRAYAELMPSEIMLHAVIKTSGIAAFAMLKDDQAAIEVIKTAMGEAQDVHVNGMKRRAGGQQ